MFNMTEDKKMGWGGARDGAGRKKQEINKKMRGFRLTDEEWAFMKGALDKYRKGEKMDANGSPIDPPSQGKEGVKEYGAFEACLLAHLEDLYSQDYKWLLEYKNYLKDESYDKYTEDEIELQREVIYLQIITLSSHLQKLSFSEEVKRSFSSFDIAFLHSVNTDYNRNTNVQVKTWKAPDNIDYQTMNLKLLKTYQARCSLQEEIQILKKELHQYDW